MYAILRSICLFFVTITTIQTGFSQTHDFRKGFTVGLKNDTTYGFLDYGTPKNNSRFIAFKKDSLSSAIIYYPDDINAYAFSNSKHYVTKSIPFPETNKSVFMEFLVNGVVDLYFALDIDGKEIYFIEKDAVLYELKNEIKIIYEDGKQYEINNQRYKSLLKFVMKDATSITEKIDNTNYSQKSLTKLAKDYHEMICDTVKCIVYSKKEKQKNDAKWKVSFGVSVGYMRSQLSETNTFASEMYLTPTLPYYKLSYGGTAPISDFSSQFGTFLPALFINVNRNQRTSLQLEVRYQNLKYPQIEFQDLSIPFLINYDFLFQKRLKPFINVGLVTDINLSTKIKDFYIDYDELSSQATAGPYPYISKRTILRDNIFNNVKFKICLGTGIKYNLTSKNGVKFDIRYEITPLNVENTYNFKNGDGEFNTTLKYYNLLFLASYYFQ